MKTTTNKKKSSIGQLLSIKRLDFLGSEFQLKYSDSDRFQTSFGGILSLFIIIMVMLAGIVTVRNLLSTTSPSVYVSYNTSPKVPKIDLYENDIFIAFSILINGGNIAEHPKTLQKYVTIKAYIETFDVNYEPGGEYKVVNHAEIDYVPCSELKDKRPLETLIDNDISKTVVLGAFVCPELHNLSQKYFVQSNFQNPPNYVMNIYVYPCSLSDRSQCASDAELRDFILFYSNVEKTLDISDKKNPLRSNVEFDGSVLMNFAQRKSILSKLKYGEVRDDVWDFFGDSLNTRYVYYESGGLDSTLRDPTSRYCDIKLIRDKDFVSCPPLLTITFNPTGTTKITTRTYAKLISSLGEIGGTAEILILLSVIIYLWYNNHYLRKYIQEKMISSRGQKQLANILFSEEDEEEELLSGHGGIDSGGKDLEVGREGFGEKKGIKTKFELLQNLNKFELRKEKELTKERKSDSEKEKMGKLQELLDENIAENEDGMFLFRSLNTIRAIEGIMLEPYHKALLPVALMNIIKIKKKEKEDRQKTNKVGFSQVIDQSAIAKKEQNDSEIGDEERPKEMDLDEAFKRLVSSKPKNQLQEMMNEFLEANLPPYFKKSMKRIPQSSKKSEKINKSHQENFKHLVNQKESEQHPEPFKDKQKQESSEPLFKKPKFTRSQLLGINARNKQKSGGQGLKPRRKSKLLPHDIQLSQKQGTVRNNLKK